MLIFTGASINNRYRPVAIRKQPGNSLCKTTNRVPHDYQVEIRAEGFYRIFRRFSFYFAGCAGIANFCGFEPDDLAGGIKGQKCACGRLGKIEHGPLF